MRLDEADPEVSQVREQVVDDEELLHPAKGWRLRPIVLRGQQALDAWRRRPDFEGR